MKFYRNYGTSSIAAAAEAYVADYMRTMQHQLPPLPTYSSSHHYDNLPPPPPPPRYYDGIPLYNGSSSSIDKRSYERSVDDFLWRTSSSRHRRHHSSERRSSRDHHHRHRDRR